MNKSILVAAGIIAASIFYHAAAQRYELTPTRLRIDRLTGRVSYCSTYNDGPGCKDYPDK